MGRGFAGGRPEHRTVGHAQAVNQGSGKLACGDSLEVTAFSAVFLQPLKAANPARPVDSAYFAPADVKSSPRNPISPSLPRRTSLPSTSTSNRSSSSWYARTRTHAPGVRPCAPVPETFGVVVLGLAHDDRVAGAKFREPLQVPRLHLAGARRDRVAVRVFAWFA